MMHEPNRLPILTAGAPSDFRSPNDPAPRVVNRTTHLLDGFHAKFEPRRDRSDSHDRHNGGFSRPR